MASKAKATLKPSKPCQQEGFCSYWQDCPFGRDTKKCLAAATDELEPDDCS